MKERIIIYGASKGGENFFYNQDQYEVVGFSDTYKAGQFLGFEIIEPKNLKEELKNKKASKVIIASIFYPEILIFLRTLKVDNTSIDLAPIQLLYDEPYPFIHKKTYELANKVFIVINKYFIQREFEYFVEFGTALGIVRDNRLINWDDDIDFSVKEAEAKNLKEYLKSISLILTEITDVLWRVEAKLDTEEKVLYYSLKFKDSKEKYKAFNIDFAILYNVDDGIKQLYDIYPKKFYDKIEYIVFENINIPLPSPKESYLEYLYDDWRVPLKDQRYIDYNYELNKNYIQYSKQKTVEV